jgi:hypothetical protein
MAEQNPPQSGIFVRGSARSLAPAAPALKETAEFVLDDYENNPSTTESPSQISQSTTPISADSEDTLTHERQPSQPADAHATEDAGASPQAWLLFGVALALLAIAFVAALAAILS